MCSSFIYEVYNLTLKKKNTRTGSSIAPLLKCHLSDTDIDLQFETKCIVFCANKPVQLDISQWRRGLSHAWWHLLESIKFCERIWTLGHELGSLWTRVCSAWATGRRLNEKSVRFLFRAEGFRRSLLWEDSWKTRPSHLGASLACEETILISPLSQLYWDLQAPDSVTGW